MEDQISTVTKRSSNTRSLSPNILNPRPENRALLLSSGRCRSPPRDSLQLCRQKTALGVFWCPGRAFTTVIPVICRHHSPHHNSLEDGYVSFISLPRLDGVGAWSFKLRKRFSERILMQAFPKRQKNRLKARPDRAAEATNSNSNKQQAPSSSSSSSNNNNNKNNTATPSDHRGQVGFTTNTNMRLGGAAFWRA